MRHRPIACALSVCLFFAFQLSAQTTSSTNSSSVQPLAALQSAQSALTRNATVNDITLTGTAEWIAGSDDDTGTATFQALPGTNRLVLNLSNGPRNEIRSANGPAGSWAGIDSVFHPIAVHNLVVDCGLFPLFALATLSASSTTVLTYVGTEVHNGVSSIHISAFQQPPPSFDGDASAQRHLSRVDIFLDPSTFLPLAYAFNSHPDKNALVDIPVEVRYSNYQSIGGLQIPLHVQKFTNNSLSLDLQFQNATLNTGLTSAQISAQ